MAARRAPLSPSPAPFTGVVLCGGASRRMGEDKALLLVDGTPMAVRVAEALAAAGAGEVLAVGGDAAALTALGIEVVPDDRPGGGPFAATLTALRRARHDQVAVLSCDLVRPTPAAVVALLEALQASGPAVAGAVPVVDGHHQWTHAVWRRSAREALEDAYATGARSLRRGAGGLVLCDVTTISPDLVADADTPADLVSGSAEGAARPGSLPAMDIPEIDVAGLDARWAEGAALIDVREDAEFADGHVPGAQHIPLGEVVHRMEEVPTDGTVYVICARGGRSAKAVAHYRAQGIDAVNVAGGMLAWIDAGRPTDHPGSGGA